MSVPAIHAITTREILARPDFLATARRIMQTLGSRGALHLRVESGGPRVTGGPEARPYYARRIVELGPRVTGGPEARPYYARRIVALGPRVTGGPEARPYCARRILEMADALVVEQERTGAMLVVNDRIDIALVTGVRAVQLPSHGLALADAIAAARAADRSLHWGVSVHTIDDARHASAAGAAWMIAGPVHATPTHRDARPLGLDGLRDLCVASAVPVIAIGGIRPADVRAVRAAGAIGVAAVRGIWSGLAAEGACREYLSQL